MGFSWAKSSRNDGEAMATLQDLSPEMRKKRFEQEKAGGAMGFLQISAISAAKNGDRMGICLITYYIYICNYNNI